MRIAQGLSRPRHPVTAAVGLVGTTLLLLVLQLSPASAERQHFVQWNGGRLSVFAERTPLAQVLGEVARLTGLDVHGLHEARADVSVRFSDLTLSEGIRRLLAHVDHFLVEDESADGSSHPALLRVLGPRSGPSSQSTPIAVSAEGPEVGRVTSIVHGDPGTSGSATDEQEHRLAPLLADTDPGMRQWAVERLGEAPAAQALPRLVASLKDDDPDVRQAALAGLGAYGEAAFESIAALLRHERAPEVRAAAAQILGQVGRARAADLLYATLKEPDTRVRVAAVEAMGYAGSPTSLEMLREATRDKEPAVRMTALRTLALYARDGRTGELVAQGLFDPASPVRDLSAGLLEALRGESLGQGR